MKLFLSRIHASLRFSGSDNFAVFCMFLMVFHVFFVFFCVFFVFFVFFNMSNMFLCLFHVFCGVSVFLSKRLCFF